MSNYSTELTDQEKKDLFKDASQISVYDETRDEYREATNEYVRWRSKVGPFVIYGTVGSNEKAVERRAPTWADVVTHLHPRFIANYGTRAPSTYPVTYKPQFHRAGNYPTEDRGSTA